MISKGRYKIREDQPIKYSCYLLFQKYTREEYRKKDKNIKLTFEEIADLWKAVSLDEKDEWKEKAEKINFSNGYDHTKDKRSKSISSSNKIPESKKIVSKANKTKDNEKSIDNKFKSMNIKDTEKKAKDKDFKTDKLKDIKDTIKQKEFTEKAEDDIAKEEQKNQVKKKTNSKKIPKNDKDVKSKKPKNLVDID